MPAIDRWVIEKVPSSHRALVAERGGVAPVCAINLSGASINPGWDAQVPARTGARTEWTLGCLSGVDGVCGPSSACTSRWSSSACKANVGFKFALDDFGTGASSFNLTSRTCWSTT
ncbi:MAG: hypothetical protein IPP44_12445 [Ideonella sp.]|nr:hypothetical protein [Ideonella sp.]